MPQQTTLPLWWRIQRLALRQQLQGVKLIAIEGVAYYYHSAVRSRIVLAAVHRGLVQYRASRPASNLTATPNILGDISNRPDHTDIRQ